MDDIDDKELERLALKDGEVDPNRFQRGNAIRWFRASIVILVGLFFLIHIIIRL